MPIASWGNSLMLMKHWLIKRFRQFLVRLTLRLASRVPNQLKIRNSLPRIESSLNLSRRLLINQILIRMLRIYRSASLVKPKAQTQKDRLKKNKRPIQLLILKKCTSNGSLICLTTKRMKISMSQVISLCRLLTWQNLFHKDAKAQCSDNLNRVKEPKKKKKSWKLIW